MKLGVGVGSNLRFVATHLRDEGGNTPSGKIRNSPTFLND